MVSTVLMVQYEAIVFLFLGLFFLLILNGHERHAEFSSGSLITKDAENTLNTVKYRLLGMFSWAKLRK